MLTNLLVFLPLLNAALGAPVLVRQNNNPSPDTDDDGVIFSPANGTSIDTDSSFNFTYLCDDDETTSVDVALIRFIRIGEDFPASGDDRRSVNVQVSLPGDIIPGRYFIAVDERDEDDDDDDDDDDDNDSDSENGDDWSEYDIISRTNNSIKSPYFITVANTSSIVRRSMMTRQDRDDDDDEAILSSPVNGTVLAPGAEFNFEYTCDDDCDSVRLALVRFYRILNDSATEVRGSDRYVSATIAIPEDVPADDYVLGVNERDTSDDTDDDDDDDFGDAFDDYFDYDMKLHTPEWDDERQFIVTVQNGTTA